MSPSSSKRKKACITTPTKINLQEMAGIAWAANIFPSWQGGCRIVGACAESISSSVCLLAGRKQAVPYVCWFSLITPQWCLTTAERSPEKIHRSVKYVIMPPSVCYLFSGKWKGVFMNLYEKGLLYELIKQKNNQTKTKTKKPKPKPK